MNSLPYLLLYLLTGEGCLRLSSYKKSFVQDKEISFAQKIVDYCSMPRSREELADKFGFGAPTYFIKTYVTPLIEEGKIKMTIPDKPKSKFQKYYA